MSYYRYYLVHSGIKGQKWGVRRFQNPDGTLTEAGKARYGKSANSFGNKKPTLARRIAIGDHPLGQKRAEDKREIKYKKKAETLRNEGNLKKATKFEFKAKAQQEYNIDRERFISSVSTGRLFAEAIRYGPGAGASRYQVLRGRGIGRKMAQRLLKNTKGRYLTRELVRGNAKRGIKDGYYSNKSLAPY